MKALTPNYRAGADGGTPVKGSVNENVMFMTVLATGLCGA